MHPYINIIKTEQKNFPRTFPERKVLHYTILLIKTLGSWGGNSMFRYSIVTDATTIRECAPGENNREISSNEDIIFLPRNLWAGGEDNEPVVLPGSSDFKSAFKGIN